MTNYALTDAVGISAAFVLFSALSFFPGYLLSHLLNIWQFRSRTLAFQIAFSVSLSAGIGPIFTFLFGLATNWTGVWLAYLAAAIAASWLLLQSRPRFDNTVCKAMVIGSAFVVFAAAWLMDWQFNSRVYFPIYAFDFGTRAAFVHSLAVFGLPAQTPFVDPGHPVALHYHFLWFLQCALIHWLAPSLISARAALIAGAIWCGLGLMCVSALAGRIFFNIRGWIVIGLLTLTGFDFIPLLLAQFTTRMHLTGILHTALWQPHYGCALIACVTGFLLLHESAYVSAFCFASAVGSGSFVVVVFAVFVLLWMFFILKSWREPVQAGLLTVVLSLPYLATLRAPAQNVGGSALLHFIASPFSPIELPLILKLLELPVYYLLEFGVVGLCVFIGYSRKLISQEWTLILMALTSIIVCTFVESAATPNNDLGWRGFMVAQFALLILAAAYLEKVGPSRTMKAFFFVGLLGTGYDCLTNRFFPIMSDRNQGPKPKWLGNDRHLGERTRANREAYAWVQNHSSPTATMAQNVDVDLVDIFSGMYGDRKILAGDRACTVGFGGISNECAPIVKALTKLYTGQIGLISAPAATFYIVKDSDPVWHQPNSWPWIEPPVFANQFVRIFAQARSYSRPR